MAGPMSPPEYAEMQKLINSKVPAAADCTCCGKAGTVQLAAHIVTPVGTAMGEGISIGSANYPQVMLLCGNCGYTRYFNAVILKGQ